MDPDFSSDHCFYERSGDHDTLLVLFNYCDQSLSVRSHARFLASAACNKLFLHSGRNDWFQNGIPGVADSFEQLQVFCRDLGGRFRETRILYAGHSMGAFAALGCGLWARSERILASSAEIDLCLPGGYSARYLRAAPHYPSVRPLIEANTDTAIDWIVGRQDEFVLETARSVAACPGIRLIELDCGHDTFVHLRDKGLLASLFSAFVAGSDLEPVLESPERVDLSAKNSDG